MMALQLATPACGPAMTKALAERGMLALFSHYDPAALQVMPPLIIAPGEVDLVLEARDSALGAVAERLGRVAAPAG